MTNADFLHGRPSYETIFYYRTLWKIHNDGLIKQIATAC